MEALLFNTNIIIFRLIDVLRDFSQDDWNLASMVCKTLWNYSGKITSTNACFGEQEGQELAELLTKYLGRYTYYISMVY